MYTSKTNGKYILQIKIVHDALTYKGFTKLIYVTIDKKDMYTYVCTYAGIHIVQNLSLVRTLF
jgi:hypothetical protein